MLRRILLHVLAGIGGLWLATRFIPNVEFQGPMPTLLIAGLVLGMMNAIVKPILNLLTLPIRILTLGLSSLVLNLLLVFALDILFQDLDMKGLAPLLWTSIAVWGVSIPLSFLTREKK